jgi:hypothetical protein
MIVVVVECSGAGYLGIEIATRLRIKIDDNYKGQILIYEKDYFDFITGSVANIFASGASGSGWRYCVY